MTLKGGTYIDTLDQTKVTQLIDRMREKNSPYLEGTTDYRFAVWMYLVDRVLLRRVGLTANDLADYPSADCYAAGMTPADAANECLEYSDFPSFCME